MLEVFFLARHIPFWGIPFIILGGEFAYMFWLKKKRKSALFCLMFLLLGLGATTFYVWVGGPDKAVKYIKTNFPRN